MVDVSSSVIGVWAAKMASEREELPCKGELFAASLSANATADMLRQHSQPNQTFVKVRPINTRRLCSYHVLLQSVSMHCFRDLF